MDTDLKIKEKRIPQKGFLRRHIFLFCLSAAAGAGLILTAIASLSVDFAEFLSTTLASFFRVILGAVSSLFPFCLSELLVIAAALFVPLWLILCVVGIARAAMKKKRSPLLRKLLLTPLTVLLCVLLLFTLTFAPCYHRRSAAEHLSLQTPVTEDRLFIALEYLIKEINAQIPQLNFNSKGQALMPADFSRLARSINETYNEFAALHPFLQSVGFDGKRVLLSPYMTYTHISGIYTFFTGESAINTNYPEYLMPYTIAHEYSHQRGIAAENEANFLAFAVCMSSSDPFIRYSGVANIFSSVANAAYRSDSDRYLELIATLSPALTGEYRAYNEFFKQYENSTAGAISSAANDAYLKANGQTQGTVTYSLTTSLVVNYCCDYLL